MEIKAIESFIKTLSNDQIQMDTDENGNIWIPIWTTIDTFRELNNNSNTLKDEIIRLKASLRMEERSIFDANLDCILLNLRPLKYASNYNIDTVKQYLSRYRIRMDEFMCWHSNESENVLYYILENNHFWKDPESFDIDKVRISYLKDIEYTDYHIIKSFFPNFIKDHYVKDLITYIENQKFYPDNIRTDIKPFRDLENFENFKRYCTPQYIIDPIPDHSYLFQRLLKEDIIEPIKQKKYMDWLKTNGFISESWYKKLITNRTFNTLKKSSTDHRESNFNEIFKL